MKKLLAFVMMLVMVISLVGCSFLPEELQASIDDIKNSIFGTEDNVEPDEGGEAPHVHDFVVVDSKEATCVKAGYEKLECACGEKQENELEALGHDMQKIAEAAANCSQYGNISYKCSRCTKKETETLKPIGHIWDELVEPSRLITCTREGCLGGKLCDCNGKYTEALKFTFGELEKNALQAKHDELSAILESAEAYDPALHAFAEEGALAEDYERVEAIYEEYSDLIFSAQGQYSIAMTLYYCNHKNKDLEKTYNDMMEYYTDLVSKFYSLSQPWYDSMYREFFFYGATEEEINAFLFDSNALANPEYTALKDRNNAIELEFNALTNPTNDDKVPELYAELVANNNRIAEILGYDNYLEYAYENVYEREYTYQDVAEFVEYVKKYIAPLFNSIYADWGEITGGNLSESTLDPYYRVTENSFFEDTKANKLFNDYIDDMNMAFTSNPDKQISFSDNLNNLMSDGNLFRGTYEGAYVTYIVDGDIPIAYFGKGYDNTFTVAHEFGHYMNEVYNKSEYNQSFDLLETHSQGDEMLYLYYLSDKINSNSYDLVETYQLLNTFYIIMAAVQVDCFEQAIYLNSYDGPNSDIIMADGQITADEYDLLYSSLSEYLGINEQYRNDTYWRYGMTISSPCYYISYSISAINCLQLYANIYSDGFDAAKDSYLKLFTYTDVDPEMTTEEILEYAGLKYYTDESLYVKLYSFYKNH